MVENGNIQNDRPVTPTSSMPGQINPLPSPPEGLPLPWNRDRLKRIFVFSFFLVLFALWLTGKALNLQILRLFSGSFAISVSLYLLLGLYLYNRFNMHGYFANYSRRANPSLHQSINRYKRSKTNEGFSSSSRNI